MAVLQPATILPPDDRRHGRMRGYCAGCECLECRQAARDYYWRRRIMLGETEYEDSRVPAFGASRRVMALAAVGLSSPAVAADANLPRVYVQRLLVWYPRRMSLARWEAIADTYLWLADSRPVGDRAEWIRRAAAAKGWAPPDYWPGDSIDDPEAWPIEPKET